MAKAFNPIDAALARCAANEATAADCGLLADAFKIAEADRLAADKVAAELKKKEVNIKVALIAAMKQLETSSVGGKMFKCEHYTVNEPVVADWPKYYAYILRTKDFSLLERRPGKAAIKERWEDGKVVPGITKFPVDKLSFTKTK